MSSRFISPRLAGIARHEASTCYKSIPPSRVPELVDRVPRVDGLRCLAHKRFNAFSKETYEKFALPG